MTEDCGAKPAPTSSARLFRKTVLQPMRPYVPGEDLSGVSVTDADTPAAGGWIAWNPANPLDQWYVAPEFVAVNYEEVGTMGASVPEAKAPSPVPTVGHIVHYVSYGTPGGEHRSACRAAVVTEVAGEPNPNGIVGLAVLDPTGSFFNRNVLYDEGKAPGTWHWPERA